MNERPTPKTKWYVTEYPHECDFAITDGNEIFALIIGGSTIGGQCDLATRIAKLPDLERERDEMREDLEFRISLYKVQESQLNDLRERLNEMQTFESTRNSQLREAIISTLEENRHLADGDDCTLAKLKSVVPDWK